MLCYSTDTQQSAQPLCRMNRWFHAVFNCHPAVTFLQTNLDPFGLCNTSYCAIMMTSPSWLLLIGFEQQSGTCHGIWLLCGPSSLRHLVWFRTPPCTSMGYWPVIFFGAICQFEQILSSFRDFSCQQGYFAYKPATDWKLFCLTVHTFC